LLLMLLLMFSLLLLLLLLLLGLLSRCGLHVQRLKGGRCQGG
jgi:hypothetical protein